MGRASKKPSKKIAKQLRLSQRVRYPEAEAKYPWLSILLDTYHVLDTGISLELPYEKERRKEKVACHHGCGNCCLRPTVPIAELETLGISWFFLENLSGKTKYIVESQLKNHRRDTKCPFLVDKACSVYPVRPIACRMFYVFGQPCQPKEDVSKTRPRDMWTHSRELAQRVAITMLPYFGITGKRQKIKAFEEGFLYSVSMPMHELAWENMVYQLQKPDRE